MISIAGEVFGHMSGMRPAAPGRVWSWSGQQARLGWVPAGGAAGADAMAADASLHLVGDIRLDDRIALAGAIGVEPRHFSDPELILRAWRKWGDGCVGRMTGDFAFAIWDEATSTLFCARDQMGVAPLFYRAQGAELAFASCVSDLVRHDDRLDGARVPLFVMGIDDDVTATAFGAIRRLPAGHMLRFAGGRLDISAYWHCEPDEVPAGEDFAQGFRERLVRAVDERIRDRTVTGAMLSGGLDSSSIVSIAATSLGPRRSDLRTFSFGYPAGSPFDERRYADAVLAAYAPTPHFVEMSGVRPLGGIAPLVDGRNDLFFAPGAAKILLLLQHAASAGVTTMLDGHGGDEVASHGFGRLSELARAGHWLGLMRELVGVSRIFGGSPVPTFARYYLEHGRGRHALSKLLRRVKPRDDSGPVSPIAWLNAEQAQSDALRERMLAWRDTLSSVKASESALHRWNVTWPGVTKAFEALRRAGDTAGISLRFPFYDRRLVTYALAVPESEKLKHGWTRAVLREAMRGLLPETVRLRRSKIDFRAELATGLAREGRERLDSLIGPGARVGDYVDLAVARRLTARLLAAPDSVHVSDLFALWRIYTLAEWLERRAALAPATEEHG